MKNARPASGGAKLKIILLILVLFLGSVFWSSRSYGWKITEELADEMAEKELEVRLYPDNPHAHFDLAITYAYTNRIEEGYKELKKVNDLDKNYAPKVIEMYNGLVAEDPSDWKLHFRLAFGHYFGGKKEKALAEFKKVIELDPKNVFAYGFIASIYADLGDFKKGMEVVKKAIRLDSNVAVLHFLLGQAYLHEGQKWEGILETSEALRLRALGY